MHEEEEESKLSATHKKHRERRGKETNTTDEKIYTLLYANHWRKEKKRSRGKASHGEDPKSQTRTGRVMDEQERKKRLRRRKR